MDQCKTSGLKVNYFIFKTNDIMTFGFIIKSRYKRKKKTDTNMIEFWLIPQSNRIDGF